MKSRALLVMLQLPLLLVTAVNAGAQRAHMPTEILNRTVGLPPLWLSADAVITASGELRSDKLPAESLRALRFHDELRERWNDHDTKAASVLIPGDGGPKVQADDAACGDVFLSLPEIDVYQPHTLLSDNLTNARSIFTGQISETQIGFFFGIPATLLRLHVETVYRSSTLLALNGDVFVVFPYARIRANGHMYCTNPRSSIVPPAVGDRLLIFDYMGGLDATRTLMRVDTRSGLFLQHADGRLEIPTTWSDAPTISLHDLDGRLRTLPRVNADSPLAEPRQ